MITTVHTALALFGVALLQAVVLNAWRDRVRMERQRKHVPLHAPPADPITVIIPARNAEQTLIPLLQDLNGQDLPKQQVEVIVVDDHSEDGTADIVEGMARSWPQLRLLRNTGHGKKAAITLGVEHATYPTILLTDADVRCGRERLRVVLGAMPGNELLVLPVRTDGDGSFLGRLQEEEQAGLLGMAVGEGSLGRPGLAYGANLAFTRSAFEAVGGYVGDRYASGDDVFLVQRMVKANKQVSFLMDTRALVTTQAERSWRAFFDQRVRWAGKMRGVRGAMPWIGAVALLLPWVLLLACARFGLVGMVGENGVETSLLLVAAWLLWIVPVVALVLEVRRSIGQRPWALVSGFCFLLFSCYAPVLSVVALVYRPDWRGRRS